MSKLDEKTRISLSPAAVWAILGVIFAAGGGLCTISVRATWQVSAVMHDFGQKLDANTAETKATADNLKSLDASVKLGNAQTLQRISNWNPWRDKANFNFETLARATGANLIPLDPPPQLLQPQAP